MLGSMRNTFGNGVKKMFSGNIGVKGVASSTEKPPNELTIFNMSLCDICALEGSTVPFIVRDICKFISAESIKLEGIFRVSAPIRQVNELRELYGANRDYQTDLLMKRAEVTEVTGHAAAGLLKQFLRQLTEPLIHDDVRDMFIEFKSLSDETFASKVCSCMSRWPDAHRCTLLFLLSFLHTVAQESENRMSVNGLAVVFGPNVFKLPDGIEGLQAQTVANQTFERLLSCSSLLKNGCRENSPRDKKAPPRPPPPRLLPATPGTPDSPKERPRRPAPPVPPYKPERPLVDESAIPELECGDFLDKMQKTDTFEKYSSEFEKDSDNMGSYDFIKKSGDFLGDGFVEKDAGKVYKGEDERDSEDEVQEEENSRFSNSEESNKLLDSSIRKIVESRLFNSTESSSISDDTDSLKISSSLLPSATAGRNKGPKNRRKPSRSKPLLSKVELDNDSEDETVVKVTVATTVVPLATSTSMKIIASATPAMDIPSHLPTHVTSTTAPVTMVVTPDSGCVVEDSEYPRNSSPIKKELASLHIAGNISPVDVFIPKLNLRSSIDEDELLKLRDATPPPSDERVPQLDLSSVIECEDPKPKPKPLPRRQSPEKVHQITTVQSEGTPPRAVPKHLPAVKPVIKKKKKKQPNHKKQTTKNPSVTSPKSESDFTEEDTMEQAREKMLNTLRENRRVAGRPFNVDRMALEELSDEKVSMQRELLKFEARYGRPITKQSKQVMREVYDRYRAVKRAVVKWQSAGVDENENQIGTPELGDSFAVTQKLSSDVLSCDESDVTVEGSDLCTTDILQQLHELRVKKRRLRRILQDFENERKGGMTLNEGKMALNGEVMTLDRGIMKSEYKQYREVKNRLRSLEIALARKGVELP